jgi:hypothetical protein
MPNPGILLAANIGQFKECTGTTEDANLELAHRLQICRR